MALWPSGRGPDEADTRSHLQIDDDRIEGLDEAWVPVRTPDGPGVLVWCNSD
ncbi:DUF6210 family protein [Actinomadura physcomitrii]|uniref:DUF6210 family protein n=1 Tax=Actinomadura physcomitrii TaxID=2650748 RepID=UPI0038B4169F